ncbi:LOW QUALITY PROTEIN: hypothetical protein U9M48_008298 [Paspalum notatum var. saurae]|uniref:Reverse transcriptase Ty1/copia-type domain-containing protein n=1 Tax=Paspalum notatum var. saurae TaxID=547442 RepID=A0AAQ3SNP3_PASNO
MEDEMRSMSINKVWDLEEIPKGTKTVSSKWVYKTKRDSKENIERHKARLVAKGFTQRERIDYTETFSPISSKDSFRIIMTLVAQYDLDLHQMDGIPERRFIRNVFMAQSKDFVVKGKENLGCRLKKSIYELNQASRQWYLMFDKTIRSFDFKENIENNLLYVDDILLASSDINLLLETKNFLSSNFDTKDIGEASYVLGIEIHRDRKKRVLGLSQKAYNENILKRYSMHKCKASLSQ